MMPAGTRILDSTKQIACQTLRSGEPARFHSLRLRYRHLKGDSSAVKESFR